MTTTTKRKDPGDSTVLSLETELTEPLQELPTVPRVSRHRYSGFAAAVGTVAIFALLVSVSPFPSLVRCDNKRCQLEPFPKPETKGWTAAHEANKNRIEIDYDYDVVFLGDDLIEEMNGNWLNVRRPQGDEIQKDFTNIFQVRYGGWMDGVALGIAGDTTSNLLWRIQHGETPTNLYAKVWWISIGSNDLATGECSVEAVALGIIRLAELVASRDPFGPVVVIQGILPRSTNGRGDLPHEPRERGHIWPSIKAVNKQLEDFCNAHDHIVYFDASKLFLNSKADAIVPELMPDFVHPSLIGHKLLHQSILEEMKRIILDEDEANYMVGGGAWCWETSEPC